MKKLIIILFSLFVACAYNVQPVYAATPMTQAEKAKAKAKAQKEKEKAKAAAEKAKAKAQAAREKEKAKAQAAREKEKAAEAKAKAADAKAKEQAKASEAKAKEQAKVQAEREQVRAAKRAQFVRDSLAREAAAEKQRQAYYKQQEELTNPKVTPTHYINLSPRIGYSLMMNQAENCDTKYIGGVGGGLQLSYMLEYKHFLFETGLAFDILSSTSQYNGLNAMRDKADCRLGDFLNPAAPAVFAELRYISHDLKESVMGGYASLPIMFGGEWDPFYFLVGARINYGAFATFKQSGSYDLNVQKEYGVVGNSYTVNQYINAVAPEDNKYKIDPLDIRAAIELGLDLDKWLQKQPDKKKAKVKPGERYPFGREHVHYKLALFAEYGLLNSNQNETADALAFEKNGVPTPGIEPLYSRTVMTSAAKQNNLFVGAKFTIGFEIPGKKPAVVPAPPSFANVDARDAETGAFLNGAQARIENTDTKRIVMNKRLSKDAFNQKLPIGEYVLDVQADGYYGASIAFHIDSIDQTVPAHVLLHKIPAPVVEEIVLVPEEVFILKNLYFATNRTEILPVSEPVISELADYLKRHADIRILIIGHTDSVGKDKANLKLSKGRAKSVMDSLIEHGIDASRLDFDGKGEAEPIDTNDTEEGRQNNRRVEVQILK